MRLWRNKFVLLLQNTSYETTAFIFVTRNTSHMTNDTWHMTRDTRQMTHSTSHMTHDTWNMTRDKWHMTRDKWHMTRETWHLTHDSYLVMILEYSLPQAPRHSALPGGTWLRMWTFSPAASASSSLSTSQTSMFPGENVCSLLVNKSCCF